MAIRSNYHAVLASRSWKQLSDLHLNENTRREIERQYTVLKDVADRAEDRQHHYYDKLIEVEGVIFRDTLELILIKQSANRFNHI